MAVKLGFKIPTFREILREIRLQKQEFMSTFHKKKNQLKKNIKIPSRYTRPFTTVITDLVTPKKENKIKIESVQSVSTKKVPSEIKDKKDKLNNQNPNNYYAVNKDLNSNKIAHKSHKKSNYLKYIANHVPTKSIDSGFHKYSERKINNTILYPNKLYPILSRRSNIKNDLVKSNDYGCGGTSASQNYSIQDSITETYQLIHHKANKSKYVKPKFSPQIYSKYKKKYKINKKRKCTLDESDKGFHKNLHESKNISSNHQVMIPLRKIDVEVKDNKNLSINNISFINSIKSSRSVQEVLTPSNAKAKIIDKEAKNFKKYANDFKSEKKISLIKNKWKFSEVSHKIIGPEASSMVWSTKESCADSNLKSASKNVKSSSNCKRKISSGDKISIEFFKKSKNKNNEDFIFEENANEEELNEAFNFADSNFDIEEDEFLWSPVAPLENQGNFSSNISENLKEEKIINKLRDKLEKEIQERWTILSDLADENIAKTCFEYFKTRLTNLDEYQGEMENLHKFIKKQKVKNYITMGFECYRQLCAIAELENIN